MQVIYQGHTIEHVAKGKTGYDKMTISYSFKGESRKQNIMSFANPAVFNAIKALSGDEVIEVTLTKDGQYTNWSEVKVLNVDSSTSDPVSTGSTSPSRATKSTYETPEERARKQVYIIKQSSLAQAIIYLGTEASMDDVLNKAQQFTDWVLDPSDEEAHDAS